MDTSHVVACGEILYILIVSTFEIAWLLYKVMHLAGRCSHYIENIFSTSFEACHT